MQITSSAALRNNYAELSKKAKDSGEPIYITVNGNGDGVFMDIDAFESLEEQLLLKSRVLNAEKARLNGAKTYTEEEVKERFIKRYGNGN